MEAEGGVIRRARLALGSGTHRPWRLDEAECHLVGSSLSDRDALRAALGASFADARPLARNAAPRALRTAGGVPA